MPVQKMFDKDACMKFLWNKETREVLGRNVSSWGKLFIFYIIFFASLGAFFAINMCIFTHTLDPQKPKWKLTDNLIGDHPGLGYRPQPNRVSNVDSSLIWFQRNHKENYKFWSNQLDDWFKDYASEHNSGLTKCSFGSGGADKYKDQNKTNELISSCFVDRKQFGECNSGNQFGYPLGQPCILIKLNRIFGWEPQGFGLNGNSFDAVHFQDIFANDMMELAMEAENNPQEGIMVMPQDLQDFIKKQVANPDQTIQWKTDFLNSVFFSCEGENPVDKEIAGPISFYPYPYVDSHYFPFTNRKDYQSPFLMIQMKKPMTGVLINIECRAWAKNIRQSSPQRLGMVRFDIMID